MSINKWILKNTSSLAGKTVAVTGTTGGLGRELCGYLASLGASLILMDRNAKKSAAFRDELKALYPSLDIECINIELESIESVKRATDELLSRRFDTFIHNAGAYSIPRRKCDSGYDNVFQINFVSPYYIIKKILPALREVKGRVMVVGSIAHNYSRIDEGDIDFSTRTRASLVYGNAKRYLTFSLFKLFENEADAALTVTHPGITFTNITAHYPKLIYAVIKHPMKIIFMHPRRAALSLLLGVFASTDASIPEWIGPRLFNIWGKPSVKRLKTATPDERERIAEIAERIYGEI